MGLPEGLPGFVAAVDKAFDRASALLKDGRKYICGTPQMTAADVTFASLAYPLILCVTFFWFDFRLFCTCLGV
jgi:glutathione S-transferase